MRSHFSDCNPASSWNKFGPALLSLAIVSAGVAGAARPVQAQDALAPNAAPGAVVAPPIAPNPDASKKPDNPQNQSVRQQLKELMQQRAQLDSRIRDLQNQLGERRDFRFDFDRSPRVFVAPSALQALTEEQKRAVQEAMRNAQSLSREAMRQAEEAMRTAQKALQEATHAAPGSNGNFFLPTLPSTPKLNFPFNAKDRNSVEWKQFQEKFLQEWKKQQPAFEQQMRQLQEQMKEWKRQFEAEQQQPSKDKEN